MLRSHDYQFATMAHHGRQGAGLIVRAERTAQ
jgi:hypothetical protein